MLVLNTTSPLVSPSAPAAVPRNQVPSSNARIASTSVHFSSDAPTRLGAPPTTLSGAVHGRNPSSSSRKAWSPAFTFGNVSGVLPTALLSTNTVAPSGRDSTTSVPGEASAFACPEPGGRAGGAAAAFGAFES